jgi:deoxyadenosine/deoxycytidine kinase
VFRVAIEGPHGVGKSALIARLCQSLPDAAAAPEIALRALDDVFERFGEGAFVLNDIVRSAKCDDSVRYWLLDRCAVSTYIHQRAEYGERAAELCLDLAAQLVSVGVLHVPELVLVMSASADTLEARLKGTGRPLSAAYLQRQAAAYEQLLADCEVQAVLGRALRVEAGAGVSPLQTAAAAQSIIEREYSKTASAAAPTCVGTT